jgi:phage terminase large subunit
MGFAVTTALKKMLRMKARKKVVQGSTSSGKTYGIIPIIYDRCIKYDRFKATVTAETLSALKDGAIDIFKNFMMDEGRWSDERWNATDFIYTLQNGSRLQFKVFDSVGKAKAAGKRDLIFINEANHIAWDIADALMIRSKEVWLDFNADERFWAHTEVLASPDAEFLQLTYLDNEAIPKETYDDLMEKKRRAEQEEAAGVHGYYWNWWQVYGLGEVGQRLELVYSPWRKSKVRPDRFQKFVYGLDFGYQHPTALIKVWYHENEVFIEEVIYKPLLTAQKLLDLMDELNVDRTVEILADYARPEMIAEIDRAGYYVLNADKSVEKGIESVRHFDITIHENAINVAHENAKYSYKKINGHLTDQIKKQDDDAMDAIRYALNYIKAEYVNDNSYLAF